MSASWLRGGEKVWTVDEILGNSAIMLSLLIVLSLRLFLSIGAIAVIGAGLSIFSGAVHERGFFDKRSIAITFIAWMMIETLVGFYDIVPVWLWLLLCCLQPYLHTGMISRLLGRSTTSALPLALGQAIAIAFVLLSIIGFLEDVF
ncbi:MAG: hypothetical protein ABIH23_18945 [bacterium]